MEKNPRDFLALALDNLQDIRHLRHIIELTKPFCGTYKIGLELFTRYGPSVLDIIQESGRNIFLDLKFHDIPNTVAQAVVSASHHRVHLCTLHTQGGKAMMLAAADAARSIREKGGLAPKLIGVTVLTSIDALSLREELCISASLQEHVAHCASMAAAAGMDGIVCSAADLPYVKKTLPDAFEVITPGIRRSGSALHDQKRTASPAEAVSQGATLLVIGREVTFADNPAAAIEAIHTEISSLPLT